MLRGGGARLDTQATCVDMQVTSVDMQVMIFPAAVFGLAAGRPGRSPRWLALKHFTLYW